LLHQNEIVFFIVLDDRTVALKQTEEIYAAEQEFESLLKAVLPAGFLGTYLAHGDLLSHVESATLVSIQIQSTIEDNSGSGLIVVDLSDVFFGAFDRRLRRIQGSAKIRQVNGCYCAVFGAFGESSHERDALEFVRNCYAVFVKRDAVGSWKMKVCIYGFCGCDVGMLSRRRLQFDVFSEEKVLADYMLMSCPDKHVILNETVTHVLQSEMLPVREFVVAQDLMSYVLDLSHLSRNDIVMNDEI
jgi:hypothetical protein